MNSDDILTIVISTYNRQVLLEKNIKRMLDYNIAGFRLIIGDNASIDDTWKMLTEIEHDKVDIIRNDQNIGSSNFYLLTYHVKTPFFLYLNDRDYIEKDGLEKLLKFLRLHIECDMVASIHFRFGKEGYYDSSRFYYFYFLANHPGLLVIKTSYFKNYIKESVLIEFVKKEDWNNMIGYLMCQQVINAGTCYYRKTNYIIQPDNRDSNVTQQRTESLGSVYILPAYHVKLFNILFAHLRNKARSYIIKKILVARYSISLRQVELEYYYSVKSENFKKRNNCIGADASEWLKNGYLYTKDIIKCEATANYRISFSIIRIFIIQSFLNAVWIKFIHRK